MTTSTPQRSDPESEQSPGVSRRLVTRAAAWSTPVVLSAATAPAYAAASSPGCTDRGSQILGGKINSTVVNFVMGDFMTGPEVEVSTSAQNVANAGTTVTAGKGNRSLQKTGYGLSYLKLVMPKTPLEGDTVTFKVKLFPPVRNFAFTITHIDKTAGVWVNNVVVSPETFSVVTSGANVLGKGTADEPFTGAADKSLATDDSSGDVTVTFTDAVQVVTISCTAGITQTTTVPQYVGVGGFSYDNCT